MREDHAGAREREASHRHAEARADLEAAPAASLSACCMCGAGSAAGGRGHCLEAFRVRHSGPCSRCEDWFCFAFMNQHTFRAKGEASRRHAEVRRHQLRINGVTIAAMLVIMILCARRRGEWPGETKASCKHRGRAHSFLLCIARRAPRGPRTRTAARESPVRGSLRWGPVPGASSLTRASMAG